MEIMGGLVNLEHHNILPIPWFMRSHLGLETGSKVWFAATEPAKRGRLPDILVSPLDPRHFHNITAVTLSNTEAVGTLADVLVHIRPPINIALADSVTLETRSQHRINLVLEQAQGSKLKDFNARRTEFVRRFSPAPNEPDYGLFASTIYNNKIKLFGVKRTEIREGMVNIGDLLERIADKHPKLSEAYDYSKLVVSSNPDQRLIRYVIPRKGVITLRIPHEDAPGVLHRVVKGIADNNYNILCSRLSRARSSVENCSTFVGECEPSDGSISPEELLRKLTADDAIYNGTVQNGVAAKDTVYPKPAGSLNVRPHKKYRPDIVSMRKELSGAKPLFVSRRFVELKDGTSLEIRDLYLRVLEEVRIGAEIAGWKAVEAPPNRPDGEIDQAVYPALWLSQAFLILAFFEDGQGKLSPNQAMELGFARGQNKPTAILIETSRISEFNVSNHSGRTFLDYSLGEAFRPDKRGGIRNKIKDWLDGISKGIPDV